MDRCADFLPSLARKVESSSEVRGTSRIGMQRPYVLFYTTKRVGGGVQDFDAIKLMKFAAS